MYSHRKKYIHFHEQLQEIMSITLLEKLPATELGCGGGEEKKKWANGRAGASKILFRLQ